MVQNQFDSLFHVCHFKSGNHAGVELVTLFRLVNAGLNENGTPVGLVGT